MPLDKKEILRLSADEKRQLAFELLDSIDEEFVTEIVPDWKKELIRERIENDNNFPSDVITWNELRKKYYGQ